MPVTQEHEDLRQLVMQLVEEALNQHFSGADGAKRLELIERIVRLEEGQKTILERLEIMQQETNRRFTAMQKETNQRFTAMQKETNQRFTAMQKETNQRFEAVQSENNRRFTDLINTTNERFKSMQRFMAFGFSLLAMLMTLYRFFG